MEPSKYTLILELSLIIGAVCLLFVVAGIFTRRSRIRKRSSRFFCKEKSYTKNAPF